MQAINKGAFQISRSIFHHEIWQDPVSFRIFFYILGHAVFSEEGIEQAGVHVKRGQYLISLRRLQDELSYREGRGNAVKRYPLTTIQRKIKRLVKEGQITEKRTEYGTLFTVVNYASYQGLENYKNSSVEQRRNSNGTATEQRWNNNKNEERMLKNDKNDKNDSTLRSKLKFETKHMKLAELLFNKIKVNQPNFKEPNYESWANTFRLMIDRDNREGKEIQDLIIWCQGHHFWYKNILSPSKLRKQFDRLQLEMKDDNGLKVIKGGASGGETSYENDYTQYDFSKRRNLRGLPEEN